MNQNLKLNLTKIPKELKLILEIIKMEENALREHYDDINWDLFLELALHHRLYPMLYTKIKKIENHSIPSKIFQSLSYHYRKNTFQMLHLCGEMEQLGRLLMENRIRPLFLKGPILAADLYGDISLRTCGDLDILISIDDLEKADEVLIGLGYEKDEYIQSLLNDWKWRHHHFTYYHPNKGTKIEIHWRLNPAPSKEPTFNELWNRKRESSIITSYSTYYMGKEDLFFFLTTHGARHGWSRLRWLIDIHQIVKKDLNWGVVHRQFKKYQCHHIAGQSLILSSQLLNTPVRKEINPFISRNRSYQLAKGAIFYLERMVNLHTEPVPKDIAKHHIKHLFSLMSFRQKLLFFLSLLHPYYTDVETLPLPRKLHFLYFPLRPVLWVWRKTKKHALP